MTSSRSPLLVQNMTDVIDATGSFSFLWPAAIATGASYVQSWPWEAVLVCLLALRLITAAERVVVARGYPQWPRRPGG